MNQQKSDYQELERILQKDLFTTLMGEKPTERAHYLHDIVDFLQGAYNDEGINHWFQRKRTELDGKSPLEYLGTDWKPEDEKAKEVLELARYLIG